MKTKIQFTKKEIIVIHKFIGNTSQYLRKQFGLTEEESNLLSDIYNDLIPYCDDAQNKE